MSESDSYYYYQKVTFLVHKEQNPVILFVFRYIVPFTLPIFFSLAFLFNNYIFILLIYVVPFILFFFNYFLFRSIDSGEMIFFKDKIQIKSEKININSPFTKFENIEIILNEYGGQKTGMYSTSRGYNNRITFTHGFDDYEFEIVLSKKNVEYLYENMDKWNEQFDDVIEIKNYSFWRFFRFGVKYFS